MRYGLGVLGIVVVALIAIVLIVSRPSSPPTSKTGNKGKVAVVVKLLEHDTSDSAVKVTTQGSLVGEEQRRSVRITVTQSQRTIDIIQGYDQNTIKSETLPNTPAAYSTFIRALNNSGFTRYRKAITDDERAYCPQGNRYIYELYRGSQQLQRLWGSSCGSSDGTFAGSGSRVRDLFQAQIPDYNKFTADVQLF